MSRRGVKPRAADLEGQRLLGSRDVVGRLEHRARIELALRALQARAWPLGDRCVVQGEGIEPSSLASKASVLPLYRTLIIEPSPRIELGPHPYQGRVRTIGARAWWIQGVSNPAYNLSLQGRKAARCMNPLWNRRESNPHCRRAIPTCSHYHYDPVRGPAGNRTPVSALPARRLPSGRQARETRRGRLPRQMAVRIRTASPVGALASRLPTIAQRSRGESNPSSTP